MKILVLGNRERYLRYMPDIPLTREADIRYFSILDSEADILREAADAEVIVADAIAKVRRSLIEKMPRLKMIHSEGVAYNAFDLKAASDRGIYVCNNKGVNAAAVAEQTILLMLALLRQFLLGDQAVRKGRQIEKKEQIMVQGLTEFSDCTVGLIGFGDIGQTVARRLAAFGCEVLYYCRHAADKEQEILCHAHYTPLAELLPRSHIVSIHVPVTPETTGWVNENFLEQIRPGALLINTARGEILDNQAVRQALLDGRLGGAGFDTLSPEPNQTDNPLIDLPEEIAQKVVYSPHIAGSTVSTFRRTHMHVWNNIQRLANGQKPDSIVNDI